MALNRRAFHTFRPLAPAGGIALDFSQWLSILAVVISGGIAIFAVYLGYRLQLRNLRAERRERAMAEACSDLWGLLDSAEAIDIHRKTEAQMRELPPDGRGIEEERLTNIVIGCDCTRIELGLSPPADRPPIPVRLVNQESIDSVGRYVIETRYLLNQAIASRDGNLRRAIEAAAMAGAQDADIAPIRVLATELRLLSAGEGTGPFDYNSLRGRVVVIESHFRELCRK